MIGSSKIMDSAVTKILDTAHSGMRQFTAIFNTTKKKNILTVDRLIKSIMIEQDFRDKFYDIFILNIEVTIEDYLTLSENYKDLTCTIIEKEVLNNNFNEDPRTLSTTTYCVMIYDRTDLFKSISANALKDVDGTGQSDQYYSTLISVDMQLIEAEIYRFRKIKFNFILKDTYMQQILHVIAYLLKISTVYIVSPDNKTKYEYYPIPPFKTVYDIFSYLQNKENGGVYNKGLSYYYTHGVLYIYPKFETDVKNSPEAVNIYKVPDGLLMGLSGYYNIENGNYNIVANMKATNVNVAEKGIEEIGSSFLIQLNEQLIDDGRTITEDSVVVNNTNSTSIITTNDVGIISESYMPEFKESNNNIYPISTLLSTYDLTIQGVNLGLLPLFAFKPGYKVTYNYDKDNIYTSETGICNKIEYILKANNKGTERYFVSAATVTLAMHINKTNQ